MRERIYVAVGSRPFNGFIMAVICINAITIGLQTFDLPEHIMNALETFDALCLGIYVAEAALKIYARRLEYFRSAWSVFDFIIIIVSFIPVGTLPFAPQIARTLRIVRYFRTLRLVSGFGHMRMIADAIGRSLPGVVWTAILLLIVHYIFAIVGIDLFRNDFPEYFGSLGVALFTLFQFATLEGWPDVARTIMAAYPGSWVFFVSYVVIASFIVVNVVVGIIVTAVEDSHEAECRRQAAKKQAAKKSSVRQDDLRQELDALKAQIAKVEAMLERFDRD